VHVLPLGQPATDVVLCRGQYAGCAPLPATTLGELGVDVPILDGSSGRGQLLPASGVQAVARAFRPSVVVTGMNYAMQLQVGEELARTAGAAFVAYFDGLRLLGSDSDISPRLQEQFTAKAKEIWVPSGLLWPAAPRWGSSYRVVGQPTLQEWQEEGEQVGELRSVRERLFGAEAVASGAPAAIWFGGYGPGYEEALRAWCEVVRRLSSTLPHLRFAHAVHPGHNYGDLDRKILRDEGVEHLVAVAPSDVKGSTAALACNLTVSQGSTGGVQSIFAGRPALFLDPARAFNNADNLGVRIGLVPDAHSAAGAELAVRQAARAGWLVDASKLAAAGVPNDPVAKISRAVRELLLAPAA